ncbi:MAG: addiction module protein [Pyrinomonadaceae bacterium]
MPLTLDELTKEALQLPADSKILLADKLIESVASEEPSEIQGLWTKEAIRRRDEIRSGQAQAVPGEQVLDEVRRLVGR